MRSWKASSFTLENAHRIVSWVDGDDVVAVHRHLPIAVPPQLSNWNDERRPGVDVLGREELSKVTRARKRRPPAENEAGGRPAAPRTPYDRLRDINARLIDAQESERSRIARELHDDIGQQLAVLGTNLRLLAIRPRR